MKPRLINVRLDEERLRKARRLRAKGIVLSDLVREAIDQKFASLSGPAAVLDVEGIVARLFAQYPDPDALPPRAYDVHDRGQARAAIRRKLSRTRA